MAPSVGRIVYPWDSDALQRWTWLGSTRQLQQYVFGYDLDGLIIALREGASPEEIARIAKYIDWNQTAAVQELAEVREEFSWKPWAVDSPFVNRTRVLDEVVDVMHFLGNILVGMGVTDRELEESYKAKQRKNEERARSGSYSAKKGGLAAGSDV